MLWYTFLPLIIPMLFTLFKKYPSEGDLIVNDKHLQTANLVYIFDDIY